MSINSLVYLPGPDSRLILRYDSILAPVLTSFVFFDCDIPVNVSSLHRSACLNMAQLSSALRGV